LVQRRQPLAVRTPGGASRQAVAGTHESPLRSRYGFVGHVFSTPIAAFGILGFVSWSVRRGICGILHMKSAGAVLALVIVALVVAYKMTFPTYSYRYRLQLTLEMDGKAYPGSSVIEVNWRCGLKIADSGCAAGLDGQATVIDLGSRGALVATLHTGEQNTAAPQRGTDAVFLCSNAFGNHSTHEELPALANLTGRRNLSAANFPYLVWFSNPLDSKSARKVTSESLSSTIDPTARFSEASVEITRDPIVIDIASKLPWFPALLREQRGKAITTWPGRFQLVYNMFVGEDS